MGKVEKREKDLKLRKKAEEVVENTDKSWDLDEIIHELRVHQVELEAQNEELRESRANLEESQSKYFDLYNFAPVGYFTLDKNGIILDVNLKGAQLLGIDRINILKTAFIQYIIPDHRNNFHKLQKALKTENNQTITLKLLKKDVIFYAHLEIMKIIDGNGNFNEFRISVSDISHLKNIEKTLKASEENFKAIAENAIDSILIAVENGKHVYVNPKAVELTGYTKEELLNTTIEDIAYPDEIINLKKRYDKRIAGKTIPAIYETCIIRKDNEIVPIEISAAKTVWKDQPAVMVIVRDISSRKKIEKKLKLASLYNRRLIEASLDPLVTIGPNGKVTDVNSATENVTGYSRDEIIGSDFSYYFTEPELAKKGYQKVFSEGFVRDYPLKIQDRKGNITPVLYNASVYRDESGEVVGVFAAARDINHIIESEKNIQLLANVVESTEDAIITKSLDGIIISWNNGAEQIYGYSSDEVVGRNISILAPGYLKQEINELIEKIKQGEKIQHYETLRLKKNGQQINVSITLSPVFDTSRKLIAISTIARDITKQKKAENDIKKSLEEKEVLIREVHHRVKNNLQIIASLLHLQESHVEGEFLDTLKESELRVKSMATIHEKVYQSDTLTDINFKDYIEKLVYDILYSYGIPKGKIQTNINIEDINLNIDTAIPLGLLINELVTNSVKYAFPETKGTITIEMKPLNDGIELIVGDDGKGLPNDINFDNSDTLGLQLVNNLTNQIEGHIEIDRSHGTQFKITFKEINYKKRI